MRDFIIRVIINAIAILVAGAVVPGIHVQDSVVPLLGVALVFSIINALVKPLLTALSCAFMVLTLGLFIFVINAAMLGLTAYIAKDWLNVDGFWPALFGGIVIAIVNMILEGIALRKPKAKN